jgi:hypothetical protein
LDATSIVRTVARRLVAPSHGKRKEAVDVDMITIPAQLACFPTPRERVAAWAPAALQGSGMSTARSAVTAVSKGANGTDATGDKAFEDPLE